MNEDLFVHSLRLSHRFQHSGDPADLQQAIKAWEELVRCTSGPDPRHHAGLMNLGVSLSLRFYHFGEPGDLGNAISHFRRAIDLIPLDHPEMPGCLGNLGNALRIRLAHFGRMGDLDEAISRYMDAIILTPLGHSDKLDYANSLGDSFLTRYLRLGELDDLQEATSRLRVVVNLTPLGHPKKPNRLSNLGNSLVARFLRLGAVKDVEDAMSIFTHAVVCTPCDHPDKPRFLNNFGNCFKARFHHLGDLGDLEDAISRYRDAVSLTPSRHIHRPSYLNNFGNSLKARFLRIGELGDIEDAILALTEAVNLTPHGHVDEPGHLDNLGASFLIRFERLGTLSDLDNAISIFGLAVYLTPQGHPERSGCLANLGNSFITRFNHFGEVRDLDEAISRLRDAIELTPHGDPAKPSRLNNLGYSLSARFECLREQSDLDDAISTLKHAIDLTHNSCSLKPTCFSNLGNCFFIRFACFGKHGDHEQAIFLYSLAASNPFGLSSTRLRASQRWISCAQRIHHPSLLNAYSTIMNLLPQSAWVGLSLVQRYSELAYVTGIVREAAAAALDSGLPEIAVEWLEKGRSVVWGELFHLRSSCEELSLAYPDHARRLREVSAALEHSSATRENSFPQSFQGEIQGGAHRTKQLAEEQRSLALERDKLLDEIRGLPGFGRFLRYKEFSRLRASAHSGPVVILNAAENRCDALIVVANVDHVIHVPLPSSTLRQIADLQKILKSLVRLAREGKSVPEDGITLKSVLSPLWKCVVKPVLDALAFSVPGKLSRIFWCPTGPFTFLPIHAAGFYDPEYSSPGNKVYDFVVSSYVPSLGILTRSSDSNMASHDGLRLLAVGQPQSDGLSRLPGVAIELQHIKDVISNSRSAPITLLESSTGTVEEVLGLMKEADWVHFACHGIQDVTLPTESGLCLADACRLKVRDIIALSRPHGGLAFLSACQTAKGDTRLSDEAIHIAAGMLFAGYAGVVGTMWSISDALAPDVARDVYGYLFRHGTARPDCLEAAHALHDAVAGLREGGASFGEWIPFIHVGL